MFILAASVALTSWATIYQDHIINMILKVLRYASYLGCVICIALNVVKQKYSKRTACFLTAMLTAAGIAIFTSGERTVFLFVLLLGCVYASNGKTILKLDSRSMDLCAFGITSSFVSPGQYFVEGFE